MTYLWIFEYNEFTWPNFKKEIERDLPLYSTYTLLIKFSFNNRTEFRMCGSQVGFFIDDTYEFSLLEELYDVILERISDSLDSYRMDPENDLDFIELLVIQHETLPRLMTRSFPKNIKGTKIEMPKKLVPKANITRDFNNNLLPLTLDERYYGKLLNLEQKKNILPTIQALFKKTKEIKESILNTLKKEKIFISWEELVNLDNSIYLSKKENIAMVKNISIPSILSPKIKQTTIEFKENPSKNYKLTLIFTSKGNIF